MKHHSKALRRTGLACTSLALSFALVAPAFINASSSVDALFLSDNPTRAELYEADKELNTRIMEESAVLMKNENNALPLKKNEKNVTVFHSISNSIVLYFGPTERYMISAVHAFTDFIQDAPADEKEPKSIYDGFDVTNINYNPIMKELYDSYTIYTDGDSYGNINTRRGPNLDVISKAEKSFVNYNDAAIITISRVGTEGYDGLRLQEPNEDLRVFDRQEGEHYLELNEGEKELISYAEEHFDKIVVLLNTPMAMEVAELQDNEKVQAIMWVGYGGWNGFESIGDLLTGGVNPSGRTADTWVADITKGPTYQNLYNNSQVSEDGKPHYSVYKGSKDEANKTSYVSIDYAEGIYVGYKFYETASDIGYFDATKPQEPITDMPRGTEDRYYNRTNGVVYPFGYGLSYTTFTQEIVEDSKSTDGDKIEFDVKVTNTGSVAGKDVVQVYYNPPYTDGGIEKATANLVAFDKTGKLKPGENETVHISFDKREMASYDYNNANKDEDGHTGYELEAGDYKISINKNSHEEFGNFTYHHATRTNYDTDENSGAAIENHFSKENGIYDLDRAAYSADGKGVSFLSRARQADEKNPFVATFPKCAGDVVFSAEAVETIDGFWKKADNNTFENLDEEDPSYREKQDIPEDWTQVADDGGRQDGKTAIQLSEMIGVDFNDELWTTFLNQLTWDEMTALASDANFGTIAVESIGKPATSDHDGPAQIGANPGAYPCMNFACEYNLASTWNLDLAEELGELMGDHGINEGITGWFGPGMNIHRSPYGGRNYEYYSEDATLSGYFAAAEIKGAVSKGIVTYMKHFVLNEQEESRDGILTWTNEQAMREIYCKPFEMAIKLGGSTGVMTSFCSVGGILAAENYALSVELLVEEWGFTGIILTDAYDGFRGSDDMVTRAQNVPLGKLSDTVGGVWDAAKNLPVIDGRENATLYYAVRGIVHRMLYTVCNSNGMFRTDENYPNIIYNFKQGRTGYQWIGFDGYWRDKRGNNDYMIPEGEYVGPCTDPTYADNSQWYDLIPGFAFHYRGDSFPNVTMAGEFQIRLTATMGEERHTALMIIYVESAFELSNYAGTANQAFTSQLSTVQGGLVSSITSCTVAEGSHLPEGLTVDNTGKISGTPTKPGVYTVRLLTNGKFLNDFTITIDGDATMRKVTFDANFEGGKNTEVQTTDGNWVTGPKTSPVRNGYVFNGWYEDKDCTTLADFGTAITADKTFYAGWTKLHTVSFNGNYTDAPTTEASVENGKTVAVPTTPKRDGYRFDGWYKEADCTNKADFKANIEADATYYAKWVKVETVTFDFGYSGAQNDVKTVDKGTKVTAPPVPERDGYRFDGWYKEADCTNKADFDANIETTTTYYAKWVEVPPFEIGDNGNWFIDGVDTGISATGPQGPKGDKGETGAAGPQGDQGEKGEKGDAGATGNGGGCGGVIGIGGAAMAAALVLGAAAFVVRKKKD